MTQQEILEELARAYYRWTGEGDITPWPDAGPADTLEPFDLAETLLPVVQDIAAKAEDRGYRRGRTEVAEYLLRVYEAARDGGSA